MILSFRCSDTERIFNQEFVRKFSENIQRLAMKKLWMIDFVSNLKDLSILPSNRLKKLKGFEHKYSIRINRQWRICFDWQDGDAKNVEIIDYH